MKYEEYVVAFGFVLLSLLWLFRVDLNFGDSFSIPGSPFLRFLPRLEQSVPLDGRHFRRHRGHDRRSAPLLHPLAQDAPRGEGGIQGRGYLRFPVST